MAGLGRPWASRDAAAFWLQLLAMSVAGALAVTAVALLAWVFLLQPAAAWWQGAGFRVAIDGATAWHWLRTAAWAVGILGASFLAILAWYCDAMLRGSGSAAP